MIDWLSKSWWQGLGVLLAVVLAIGGLWWQQNRKELSYEVVSQTSLVSLEDPTAQQLQVFFNGKQVADPSLIVLRVRNTGNVPIPRVDYEKPLTFQFGQSVEVLNSEITSMTPTNLGASINPSANSVELSPVLLNSSDELLLKTLVTGSNITITVDARIIGVSSIEVRKANELSPPGQFILFCLSIISISSGLYLCHYWYEDAPNLRNRTVPLKILSIFGILISIFCIINGIFIFTAISFSLFSR